MIGTRHIRIQNTPCTLDWSGRGYVTVGARGHTISCEMDPAIKEKVSYDETAWRSEMNKLETQAIEEMRKYLKKRKK